MGYRSEVAIVCDKDTFERIYETASTDKFAPDSIARDLRGNYKLDWSYVKWYEDYDEVQHIRDILINIDETSERFACFYRIGEDYDDIEVEDFGNRELSFDYWLDLRIKIGGFTGVKIEL